VADARGMLGPALADPDPVLLFEHVQLYGTEDEIDEAQPVDIARARVRRAGRDLSLITHGGCLPLALAAAATLAAEGIEAEVIDLRVLRPLDEATVIASVRKCRRAVVIDEGWRSVGLAAEVAARIAEQAFWDLDAPPARVCAEEVPIPYARHLEQAALPSAERVLAAARGVLGAGGAASAGTRADGGMR
jgi:pyruvate dehydrogenase E1 component beta subunit